MKLSEITEGALTRDAGLGFNKTSAHKFTVDVDARDGSVDELLPRIVKALSDAGIRAEVEGKEGFTLR